MTARAIRVLLVDDHAVLRAGLKVLIDAQPDMGVAGEAGSGEAALTAAREAQPDVAVVDLTLPGMHGLQVIEALRSALPATRILVLTMHDDPEYVRPALAAGASAYLVKHVADTELISSIRAVHDGGTVVYLKAGRPGLLPEDPAWHGRGSTALSPRERDVLRLIASGHTQQEVARRLHIRPKTVETYRSRLSKKLGFSTRAELVRYALDTGVLGEQNRPSPGASPHPSPVGDIPGL